MGTLEKKPYSQNISLWAKKNDDGKGYFGGDINIAEKRFTVILYPNKSANPNAPVLTGRIYEHIPKNSIANLIKREGKTK